MPPNPFEQSYRDIIDENITILRRLPANMTEALEQSQMGSYSDDKISRCHLLSSFEDCLNAVNTLSRISRDLELLVNRS